MLLGHRYYDPSVGRFISQDPAQDESNWYAYCGNNPLVATDPTGLFAMESGMANILVSGGYLPPSGLRSLVDLADQINAESHPQLFAAGENGNIEQVSSFARAVASKDPNNIATAVDGLTGNDEVASAVEQAIKRATLPDKMRYTSKAMKSGGKALILQIIDHVNKLDEHGLSAQEANHWLKEITVFVMNLGKKMKA
jgi:uncharacterized protein RhaS with RHS repeats